MNVKSVLKVARANFLLLPLALVAVGASAAFREGRFFWDATLLALVGLVALHVAVNAFNEASDFRTGIDLLTRRTPFSGGSGALPAGEATPGLALSLAWGGFLMGCGVGVYFFSRVGWPLVPIAVLGAVAVLFYTPYLTRLGVGELFAGLGLGFLPVLGVSLVQGGTPGPTSFWAAVPAAFMTFNLLLLNEFPDEEADRRGGRRHLVILLGRKRASRVYALAVVAVPATVALGVALRALPPAALVAVLPTALCAPGLRWAFTNPEADPPFPALGGNVAWNLLTNLVLAATLVWG
ncbi:MAG: prenyltransferase [Thermoanaerobaculum sp.]